MENDPNQETNEQEPDEMSSRQGKTKQWFQDNLRIIISILIVVLIAGGIYSYSKRTGNTGSQNSNQSSESQNIAQSGNENSGNSATDNSNVNSDNQTQKSNPSSVSAPASQETDQSFIETAAKGDSRTKLARRALADYLEKTPDSSLTPEHKIYIEDFLRKNVGFQKSVRIGTSVEFSKNLIQEGITKAKTLNDRQLQNLHKFAVRVPSLS